MLVERVEVDAGGSGVQGGVGEIHRGADPDPGPFGVTAPRSARSAPGDGVNLERPVRLADRLGGHIVQGHVDAIGDVVDSEPQADGSTA